MLKEKVEKLVNPYGYQDGEPIKNWTKEFTAYEICRKDVLELINENSLLVGDS
jgi:hexokinase